MKTVLYADILLLINFSMDFISLYLTFLLMRRKLSAIRGTLAATFGGIAGVALIYFEVSGLKSFVLSFGVSFIMMLICLGFKLKFKYYIKYTVFLWGMGALLAGGVTFVCNLGDSRMIPTVKNNGAEAFLVLALGAVLARAVLKVIITAPKAKECAVEICCFGVKTTVSAMVDSGNLVTEPMSGLPVIFVRKSVFSESGLEDKDVELLSGDISGIDSLSPDTRRRARVISVKRVGETKLLPGIVATELFVGTGKNRKNFKAVMVIENVSDYGGYDAVVPESAVK